MPAFTSQKDTTVCVSTCVRVCVCVYVCAICIGNEENQFGSLGRVFPERIRS